MKDVRTTGFMKYLFSMYFQVTPPIFNLPVNNKDELEYVKLIYFKLMLSVGLQFVQYSSSQLGYLQYERMIEEKILLFKEVLEFELALVKVNYISVAIYYFV